MATESRTMELVMRVRDYASGALGTLLQNVGKFTTGISAAGLAFKFLKDIRDVHNANLEFLKLSESIGASTEELSGLSYAFHKAGVDGQNVVAMFKSLEAKRGAALRGSDQLVETFRMLGVSSSQLRELNTVELIESIADGIAELGGGTEASAQAAAIFEERTIDVIRALRGGRAGLRAAAAEAEAYGRVVEEQAARATKQLATEWAALMGNVTAGARSLHTEVVPALSDMIHFLNLGVGIIRARAGDESAGKALAQGPIGLLKGLTQFAEGMRKLGTQDPGADAFGRDRAAAIHDTAVMLEEYAATWRRMGTDPGVLKAVELHEKFLQDMRDASSAGGFEDAYVFAPSPNDERFRQLQQLLFNNVQKAKAIAANRLQAESESLMLAALGLGDQDSPQLQQRIAELDASLARLDFKTAALEGKISADELEQALQLVEERLQRVSEQVSGDVGAAFSRGMKVAWRNWTDLSGAIEGGTAQLIDGGLNRLADSIANLFITGKFEAKAFFAAILQDLSQLGARIALIGLLKAGTGLFLAEGGVTPGVRATYPIRRFAEGGVATRPTIAVFGEAGEEAFVPLKGGRIPVALSGSGRSGGASITFNITAPAPGSVREMLIHDRETIYGLIAKALNGGSAEALEAVRRARN